MIAKKPKNPICPRCGYGMAPRRKGNHCIECTQADEKKKAAQLQIKKINIAQKSAAVEKPKISAKKPSASKKRAAKNNTPKKKATPALRRHTRT